MKNSKLKAEKKKFYQLKKIKNKQAKLSENKKTLKNYLKSV